MRTTAPITSADNALSFLKLLIHHHTEWAKDLKEMGMDKSAEDHLENIVEPLKELIDWVKTRKE